MSEPYDHSRRMQEDERDETRRETSMVSGREADGEVDGDVEEARENVFDGWPSSEDVGTYAATVAPDSEPEPEEPGADPAEEPAPEPEFDAVQSAPEVESELELEPEPVALVDPDPVSHEHAPGEFEVPPGYGVLEGIPDGTRRAVAIVVSRFNGEITSRLLTSALDELDRAGVAQTAVTVMPVPGAFELPIGAMALARTRRFACVVALGCVIRGDTPHFDYVASEAASGLQLAALETGVPVSFGVLTLDREDQAEARIDKGAEAVRTALEMADLFSHLRAAAAR